MTEEYVDVIILCDVTMVIATSQKRFLELTQIDKFLCILTFGATDFPGRDQIEQKIAKFNSR